ncbi:MAG: phage holin, LLH family [Firmicutes bacterium]|nr:phage holin, LLH family [Bacillota bacterium]
MEWEVLVSILATGIPLLGGIIACAIRLVKSFRYGQEERRRRLWAELARSAISYAETIRDKINGELTGDVKKQIAMEKVEFDCLKNGVSFERDKVSMIVEDMIDLTKRVNSRDKDNHAVIESLSEKHMPTQHELFQRLKS